MNPVRQFAHFMPPCSEITWFEKEKNSGEENSGEKHIIEGRRGGKENREENFFEEKENAIHNYNDGR